MPDGQITSLYRKYVKPRDEKYFTSVFQKYMIVSTYPGPARGRFGRSSRNVGRDAMDADGALDEACCCGRRNRVVLISRRWDQA
jgi:hypothetical protein